MTTDAVTLLMKMAHATPTKENPYQGITHEIPDYFINDPRFCEVWKKNKCANGIHAFDEVWSEGEHYLSCDVCNLVVNIKNIDTSWVEDEE